MSSRLGVKKTSGGSYFVTTPETEYVAPELRINGEPFSLKAEKTMCTIRYDEIDTSEEAIEVTIHE